MHYVSQSEFARMCGVSRQAVAKWKGAGRLVLQGNQVDVEATDERMQRYHEGGSPLRRQGVTTVDARLTNAQPVDRTSWKLSTNPMFHSLDGMQTFDLTRAGLARRVSEVACILGFESRFKGEDIDLLFDGESHFLCDGHTFEENAYCALDMLRWWLGSGIDVPVTFLPAIPLLARPFGTLATIALCENCALP